MTLGRTKQLMFKQNSSSMSSFWAIARASLLTLALTSLSWAQPSSGKSPMLGSSSAQPTATPIAAKTGQVSMEAVAYEPQVTIWVNDTSATQDDLVRYDDGHLFANDAITNCTIFVSNPNGQDVYVILNHPDDRVSFVGEDANKHISLTLDGQGALNHFQIRGSIKSSETTKAAINVHEYYVTNNIIGSAEITVYYFIARVVVGTNGMYSLTTTAGTSGNTFSYKASPSAVDLTATIQAAPTGVDASAPQIANLRAALVQNMKAASYTVVSSNPYVITNNSGGPLTVPATRTLHTGFAGQFNDRNTQVTETPMLPSLAPYDDVNTTSTLTGSIHSNDNPSWGDTPYKEVYDAAGNLMASYSYNSCRVTLKGAFTDYAVLYDPTQAANNYNVLPLRQTGWPMNLDSDIAGQYIKPNLTNVPYVSGMVPAGASANSQLRAGVGPPQYSTTTTTIK